MNTKDTAELSGGGVHVLIVDDAEDSREMYAAFLAMVGQCRVSQLSVGTDVVATVMRERPDVVVLDLLLPGIDGFELCHQLRHSAGIEETPLVVLTAMQPLNAEQRSRLERERPDAVLVKPCPPETLLEQIRHVLTRARRLRAAAASNRGL